MAPLLYFAYGSNMCEQWLKLSSRVPSAQFVTIGHMDGFKLTFDKISKDGSGKCDAEKTGLDSDRVYGVLYRVPLSEKKQLDIAEGLNKGYQEDTFRIVTSSGPINAKMYYATRKDPSLKPYHWYKALVLEGAKAHSLPDSYVSYIEAVEAIVGEPPKDYPLALEMVVS